MSDAAQIVRTLLQAVSTRDYERQRACLADAFVIELTSSGGHAASRERLARYEQHTIEVVVDRLVRRAGIERRLTDSLETALRLAEGVAEVEIVPRAGEEEHDEDREVLTFSEHLACASCGLSFEELAPRNFSFNSPYGACEECDGLGTRFQVDPELVISDDDLSIDEGAIAPWSGFRGEYFKRVLAAVADDHGFSTATPWKKLKAAQKKIVATVRAMNSANHAVLSDLEGSADKIGGKFFPKLPQPVMRVSIKTLADGIRDDGLLNEERAKL